MDRKPLVECFGDLAPAVEIRKRHLDNLDIKVVSILIIRCVIICSMPRQVGKPASLTESDFAAQSPIALGRRFYQIAVAAVAEVHEVIGLIPLEFAVLIHLHDAPGIDQNTLAERMALDRTSTGALVYRLEQQGLVERQVNGTDRRARVLRLTPRGRAVHNKQRPKARAAQERLLEVLTPVERRSLVDMMKRVIAANPQYARPGAGRRRPHTRRRGHGNSIKGG
jgi:DNA-binding MarR family transcriptional regulator